MKPSVAALRKLRAQAAALALKHAAQDAPAQAVDVALGRGDAAAWAARVEVLTDRYLEALGRGDGTPPPDDNAFGSVDAPPEASLYLDVDYKFTGTVAGRPYEVFVQRTRLSRAERRLQGFARAAVVVQFGAKRRASAGGWIGLGVPEWPTMVSAPLLAPGLGPAEARLVFALWARLLVGFGDPNGWRVVNVDAALTPWWWREAGVAVVPAEDGRGLWAEWIGGSVEAPRRNPASRALARLTEDERVRLDRALDGGPVAKGLDLTPLEPIDDPARSYRADAIDMPNSDKLSLAAAARRHRFRVVGYGESYDGMTGAVARDATGARLRVYWKVRRDWECEWGRGLTVAYAELD